MDMACLLCRWMERDKALRVHGHRSSSVLNIVAGTAIARLRTLRVYDTVFRRNASRNEACGHIRVRKEHKTSSKADSSVHSCRTDIASLSGTGISGTPRPPHGSCEQLEDGRIFSVGCMESCTAVAWYRKEGGPEG